MPGGAHEEFGKGVVLLAAILPGSPPGFDRGDMAGTLKSVCNYERVLQENVDFQLGQVLKTLNELSGLASSLQAVEETLAAVQASVGKLAERVAALESGK